MVPGMASQALDHSPEDSWTDEAWVSNLHRVLNTLMALRDTDPEHVADAIGMGRSTLYGKLKSGKFSGLELIRLGRALGVQPGVFYTAADDLLSAIRTGSFAPLALVRGDVKGPGQLFDDDLQPIPWHHRAELTPV